MDPIIVLLLFIVLAFLIMLGVYFLAADEDEVEQLEKATSVVRQEIKPPYYTNQKRNTQ